MKATASNFLGHGWRIKEGAQELHIGHLPGRKQICLYIINGNIISVLAFFKKPRLATLTLEILDKFILSKGE